MWWKPSPERRFRRDKYADYFYCLDQGGQGRIDRSNLGHYASVVREQLNLSPDSAQLSRLNATTQAMWACLTGSMDARGEGNVRLDELVGFFVDVHNQSQHGGALPETARDHVLTTFAVLDLNGDGAISKEEYRVYLRALGSDSDPDAAWARLAPEGAGELSIAQIEALYDEWLRAGDPAAPGNYLLTGRLPRE